MLTRHARRSARHSCACGWPENVSCHVTNTERFNYSKLNNLSFYIELVLVRYRMKRLVLLSLPI